MTKDECDAADFGNKADEIDYEKMYFNRFKLLRKAYERFSPDKEYEKFIKENEMLNHYDDIMGKYSNNDPIAKTLVKSIPDSFYDDVENIVKNKIDELNL